MQRSKKILFRVLPDDPKGNYEVFSTQDFGTSRWRRAMKETVRMTKTQQRMAEIKRRARLNALDDVSTHPKYGKNPEAPEARAYYERRYDTHIFDLDDSTPKVRDDPETFGQLIIELLRRAVVFIGISILIILFFLSGRV